MTTRGTESGGVLIGALLISLLLITYLPELTLFLPNERQRRKVKGDALEVFFSHDPFGNLRGNN